MIDVITVVHNEKNAKQAEDLFLRLNDVAQEEEIPYTFCAMDNRQENKGFVYQCNYGASMGKLPIIGFLNPDLEIQGEFLKKVLYEFEIDENVVICGERFGKSNRELRIWGLSDWVCGAALFVRRSFWEEVGGFDRRFTMYFEETDLCRRAEQMGYKVKSLDLLLAHDSPTDDSEEDVVYKHYHFARSAALYNKKWNER